MQHVSPVLGKLLTNCIKFIKFSVTLIKQISPVNCQNTDITSHVPPETVIYWITVTQQ